MEQKVNEYAMEIVKFIACVIIAAFILWVDKNRLMLLAIQSCHLSDALSGILTFATLMIGFLGVLLPAVMSTRQDSKLVEKFFSSVPSKRFSLFIRNNILSGLFLNICSIAMFFSIDLLENGFENIALWIGRLTTFGIIYFSVTTFCVLNLLLRLLIEED